MSNLNKEFKSFHGIIKKGLIATLIINFVFISAIIYAIIKVLSLVG